MLYIFSREHINAVCDYIQKLKEKHKREEIEHKKYLQFVKVFDRQAGLKRIGYMTFTTIK